MVWTLPEPVLAVAVDDPRLPAGCAAEPKWDGYRALVERAADGTVLLRSRRGTDMNAAFPEVTAAADRLPDATAFDGEIVVWDGGRLAFERLQGRLNRTGAAAARSAEAAPAHFVVFDLLRIEGADLTSLSYRERRTRLEALFARDTLGPAWALCPSTTDPATAAGWLEWSRVGMEGLVFKGLADRYRPGGRDWRKYRATHTADAVVGAVSGSLADPRTALLGRYDGCGRLRYAGRTSVLSRAAAADLSARLEPPSGDHPWSGRAFSAGHGGRDQLPVVLVRPEVVLEVRADTAGGAAGSLRHAMRPVRVREDLDPADVPLLDPGGDPDGGG